MNGHPHTRGPNNSLLLGKDNAKDLFVSWPPTFCLSNLFIALSFSCLAKRKESKQQIKNQTKETKQADFGGVSWLRLLGTSNTHKTVQASRRTRKRMKPTSPLGPQYCCGLGEREVAREMRG